MNPSHEKRNTAPRLAPALEVKLADTSAGVIEGYGSVFGGMPDSYGDVIAAGAFRRTIAEHRKEGTMPALLWAHSQANPIGRWETMAEDSHGLKMSGRLNLDTAGGRDAHAHLKARDVGGLSIGFYVPEGGRTKQTDGSFLITDVDIVECSVVACPANRRARVASVKSLQTKSELIDLLREGGLEKAAAQRIAGGGWPALAGEDEEKATKFAEMIAKATANLRTAQ